MKIATWNVNSVRAREERLLRWLAKESPDVVCVQELKVADDAFPHVVLRAAGWRAAVHGQKTYNGVAILAKGDLGDVVAGLGDGVDDPQARLIAATVRGVRIVCAYVPNGQEVGTDKWAYKLAWLGRLRAYLDRRQRPDQPVALCGDLNVAPEDRDVHDPDAWAESVLCHPDVRGALARVVAFGLTDAFRLHHAEGDVYSWWDYRQLAFPKNHGLRLDHVFVTEPLAKRCTGARIDRDERKGDKPSDHAPVVVEIDVP